MSLKILEIDRWYQVPDSEIVSLVGEVVGHPISSNEFDRICDRLSGEDYTIAKRFWPALRHLYDIVKFQNDENERVKMVITLATTTRYAVWKMFSLQDFEPKVREAAEDCCRLFLETCFSVKEVDDRRYLLMGVAAAMGDSEAAKLLHDLGSGYQFKSF